MTPKNYLDFISNYRNQLAHQRKVVSTRIRRLEGGLTKLSEAQTAVDRMSVDLRVQKTEVDAKTLQVEALIRDIGERQAIADRQQADAQAKQKDLEVSAVMIEEESAKANVALEAALPALEDAARALDNLDKDSINEIKSFTTPTPLVQMVTMCVLHLRPTGKEDETGGWKACKAMMSDTGFLKSLKVRSHGYATLAAASLLCTPNRRHLHFAALRCGCVAPCLQTYDKEKLNDKMIRKVQQYFKEKDLNVEKMKTCVLVVIDGCGLQALAASIP